MNAWERGVQWAGGEVARQLHIEHNVLDWQMLVFEAVDQGHGVCKVSAATRLEDRGTCAWDAVSTATGQAAAKELKDPKNRANVLSSLDSRDDDDVVAPGDLDVLLSGVSAALRDRVFGAKDPATLPDLQVEHDEASAVKEMLRVKAKKLLDDMHNDSDSSMGSDSDVSSDSAEDWHGRKGPQIRRGGYEGNDRRRPRPDIRRVGRCRGEGCRSFELPVQQDRV